MKAIGIVRRIDELGRIVIPIELRRNMRLKSSDEMEMYVDNTGDIILKKYSKLISIEDSLKKITDILNAFYECVLITNTSNCMVYSEDKKDEFYDKLISNALEKKIQERKSVILKGKNTLMIYAGDLTPYVSQIIVPINVKGDIYGAIILLSTSEEHKDSDIKCAEIMAKLIEKELE